MNAFALEFPFPVEQFCNLLCQPILVKGRCNIGRKTKLLHPKHRFCRCGIPCDVRTVEEIDVPGDMLDFQYVLPFHTGEFVWIPEVGHTGIIEFRGPEVSGITIVRPENIDPNDIHADVITRIGAQRLLNDGEPPSTCRSGRRQECDEPDSARIGSELTD